jgi:hypothetical protein
MTRTERVGTFFGACKLRLSDQQTTLLCSLQTHQDYHGDVPTLQHVDGKFENLLYGDAAIAMIERKPLELILEDGRQVMILVTSLQGHFVVTEESSGRRSQTRAVQSA